ncbi:MAG: dTMP kinase [Candidatus Saccharibacteria bacterium]|nr:dTMP kinase [Candidatus Saccharibacteria bacterium]MCY4010519.1 dTMP kinase [Candidatus Saccharibacteria bacterium]MCY4088698.1 dTMP kinase [Candidatus Saccharibacteria bacterium]
MQEKFLSKSENKGSFLVIEGSDGCGKATQTELLVKHLTDLGWQIEKLEFPRYDNSSSFFIQKYLSGQYGDLEDINPKTASLFFALDRYDAKEQINQALNDGKIIISDRFVASNLAHQGAKIEDLNQRTEFFQWIYALEFDILHIPRPDLNLILNIPTEISQKLLKQQIERRSLDIHEENLNQQIQSRQIYHQLCQDFSDQFIEINCLNHNQQLLSIEQIQSQIQSIVNFHLKS